jgi:3-oxoacyl-[acyl-carrier protein] reductase
MGHNIILTGASKGLGLTTAQILLESSCSVYAINRTITPEIELLQKQFPELYLIEFDLSKTVILEDFIKTKFPFNLQIHGIINNAAMAYDDLITNLSLPELETMYRVNVFSPMILTKMVIRHMLFHHIRGSIVHVSSISVHTGYKGLAMYASTKGALEAFSKNTAREWGEKGIRSNCVVAGFMETQMSSTLKEDQKNRIYQRTALKLPTSKDSVAETIAFLLSDKAASITGQNIFVDSGTI